MLKPIPLPTRSTRWCPSITAVRRTLLIIGACLLGLMAILSSPCASAAVLSIPEIQVLQPRSREPVTIPHGVLPAPVPLDFGLTDPVTIGALRSDEESEVSLADKTAKDIGDDDAEDDDLLKKCMASTLLAIAERAASTRKIEVGEAVSKALKKCLLDRYVNEPTKATVELSESFAEQTTEDVRRALVAARTPPAFLSWAHTTAGKLDMASKPAPAEPTTPGSRGSRSGGVSTQLFVAVALIAVATLFTSIAALTLSKRPR